MAEVMIPSGYRSYERSIDDALDHHMPTWCTLPEFRERVRDLLIARNGVLGLGDVLPREDGDGVSAASSLNRSFHQRQKFRDGRYWCMAIDFVVRRPGGWHTSGGVPVGLVPVQGSAEARKFGIHANIGVPGQRGFESWHGQCVEVDGWWGWTLRARPYPDPNYPRPGLLPSPTSPPKWPVFAPGYGLFSLYPLNKAKPLIRPGSKGDIVKYLQGVLRKAGIMVVVDGDYGPQTTAAVRTFQQRFDKVVSGMVGWGADHRSNTWEAIDRVAVF